MSEELDVLKAVTERLENAGIEYMVSGSIAANYYTVPRMTRDIDIVLELKADYVPSFIEAFEKDFYVDSDVVKAETGRRGIFNLIHKDYALKVDCILRKETDFQDSSFKRRKKVHITGDPIFLISPEDLVIAKLLWAKDSLSELQLNDVKNIFKKVNGLDCGYINTWVQTLALQEVYEKVT